MSTQTTDAGEIRVVGQNPVMYLYQDPGAVPTTSANLWRVDLSPVGPGNVLFFHSELTGGEPKVYADNIALSRFLQEEIIRKGQPYKDAGLPVAPASFTRSGAIPWHLTECVESGADRIELSWYEFSPSFAGHTAPARSLGETYGHYAVYVPARRAQALRNGVAAAGLPGPLERDGRDLGSAFVALAESWQRYG